MTREFVGLRISADAKQRIEDLAKTRGVSVNEFLKGVLEAKAGGSEDASAIATDYIRRIGGQSIRHLIDTTATAASHLLSYLQAISLLKADLEADLNAARTNGHYYWWNGEPDKETRASMKVLEGQLALCDQRMLEIKAALLLNDSAPPADEPGAKEDPLQQHISSLVDKAFEEHLSPAAAVGTEGPEGETPTPRKKSLFEDFAI